jgi:glycosyltransferase 2 family protein
MTYASAPGHSEHGWIKRLLNWRILIWLFLAPLFVWAIKSSPLQETCNILRDLKPVYLVVLLVVDGFIVLLFSSRWWLILTVYRRQKSGVGVPFLRLTTYRQAAFSISYFTPGTQFGGEPLQVHLLQARHSLPVATATASVALDKLFEIISNFAFLLAGIFVILWSNVIIFLPRVPLLLTFGCLMLLPGVYVLVLLTGHRPLSSVAEYLPLGWQTHLWARKTLPLVRSTEAEMQSIFRERPFLPLGIAVLAGFTWIVTMLEYWLMVLFLGQRLSLPQTFAALTAARIAFLAPVPAGLGTLEGGQVFVMQAMGFDPALGLSIGLLIRLRDLLFGLVGLGFLALYTRKSTERRVLQPDETVELVEAPDGKNNSH